MKLPEHAEFKTRLDRVQWLRTLTPEQLAHVEATAIKRQRQTAGALNTAHCNIEEDCIRVRAERDTAKAAPSS